jgi:hypothetical protein
MLLAMTASAHEVVVVAPVGRVRVGVWARECPVDVTLDIIVSEHKPDVVAPDDPILLIQVINPHSSGVIACLDLLDGLSEAIPFSVIMIISV